MSAYIQLIPGHEAIGTIVEMGKNVKGFSIGDRCVADVGITVSHGCFLINHHTDFPSILIVNHHVHDRIIV